MTRCCSASSPGTRPMRRMRREMTSTMYDDHFLDRLESGGCAPRCRAGACRRRRTCACSPFPRTPLSAPMTRPRAATWCSASTGPATTPGPRSPPSSPGSVRLVVPEVVPTLTPVPQLDGELIADIDDDGVTRHVVAFGLIREGEPRGGRGYSALVPRDSAPSMRGFMPMRRTGGAPPASCARCGTSMPCWATSSSGATGAPRSASHLRAGRC